jgi:hypothetical protein
VPARTPTPARPPGRSRSLRSAASHHPNALTTGPGPCIRQRHANADLLFTRQARIVHGVLADAVLAAHVR